jgi:putative inorganic carbon (hco3(-)) transporter
MRESPVKDSRVQRALPLVTVSVVLLGVWPPSQSAFHDPKRWVFVVAAGLSALISLPKWRWTALPLIALTSVQTWHGAEAGLQAMAFAWALAAWHAELRLLTRVLAVCGAIIGLVVLLQAVGLDVFGFAQPQVGESRLTLYGTLGNPDFVASVLLPVAILLLPLPWRGQRGQGEGIVRVLCLVPIVGALIITRSFATVLSAGVALGVLALSPTLSPAGRGRQGNGVVLFILIALLSVGLLGRDLGQTIAGRRYLISVATPHVVDAPVFGHGLGSTVLAWPTWELSYWQARCPDAACVAADPQRRFAAEQDHVHSDFLEFLLERGVLGLLAMLLALSAPLITSWRNRDTFLLAAMAAMLTRALVDFPLHRPADLCLFAALAACTRVNTRTSEASAPT